MSKNSLTDTISWTFYLLYLYAKWIIFYKWDGGFSCFGECTSFPCYSVLFVEEEAYVYVCIQYCPDFHLAHVCRNLTTIRLLGREIL